MQAATGLAPAAVRPGRELATLTADTGVEFKFTGLEEDNVCLFIMRNVLELVVESWSEAGIGESLLVPH